MTRPLSEFREEPRLTQEEMRAVVRAAAVRIADEIGGPRRGGLDSATGVRVSVTELADRRPETDKIGYRRGSGGGIIGTFQAPKPIPALQEAISGELVKDGMLVDGAQPDRVLAGTITAFWIDDLAGVGEVAVEIEVRDASTGEVRHTGQYVGRDTMHGYGSDEDWGEVMNGAVEDMVRALGADSKLV